MPNKKSAEKRVRGTETKTLRNRAIKTQVRNLEKKFRVLAGENKRDEAGQTLIHAVSAIDKATKKGAIPKRRASDKKARLTRVLNAVSA